MPQRSESSDGMSRGFGGSDDPIQFRRHLDALRRSRWLIVAVAATLTIAVVAISSALPDRYSATASIVRNVSTQPYSAVDANTVTRELATIDQLLTTSTILDAAATKVPGETGTSLSTKVSSEVDPNANLIFVTAKAGEADRAARIANAVAQTFVDQRKQVAVRQYESARASLQTQLDELKAQPGATTQADALRQRLSELDASNASVDDDLTIGQRADPPTAAESPKPMRNGILALFLGLFLGVLIALGREQLVPRVGGPRELSRLLDLPILTTMPYVRRRFGARPGMLSGAEYEAYQSLGASVRFALPPADEPRLVLVTSALHAEGKSTVTAQLGRALAQAGHRTLILSADLRWPTQHELLQTRSEPGLGDLLLHFEDGARRTSVNRLVREAIVPASQQPRRGSLDVLPAGKKLDDPGRLLAGAGMEAVFNALMELDYAYVLVDSAPLLGIVDTQALARRVQDIIFVARLDRLSLDAVFDVRDTLERFEVDSLGLVVVGGRGEASPYYLPAARPTAAVDGS
jgi:Mrp family chromosome partitioning ATPase/capsular polysaccharide biosynthesis protein